MDDQGIKVRQLCVSFDTKTHILQGLNLDILEGEVLALLGASGCGKSTLLRAIAGLITPRAGSIDFTGRVGGKMSYVFQDATLLPWRTVHENVRLPLELTRGEQRASRSEVDRRVAQALEDVELDPASWKRFPRQLSGGMKMRASIARALVTEPEVLLLDEPFAALDDLLRTRLNELVLQLWQARRRTIIFVTHNIAEAVYMSHRIAVFGRGNINRVVENRLAWPRTAVQRSEVHFAEQYSEVSRALVAGARVQV
jgi:NitT/TauT family transport system ATP-binding protein